LIDAILGGRIHGTPTARTSKTGSKFVTCKLRVATSAGETVFANCICFAAQPVAALLALGDGDAIAIAAEITPKAWLDKNGEARPQLDAVVHGVLSPLNVQRRRKAAAESAEPERARAGTGGEW